MTYEHLQLLLELIYSVIAKALVKSRNQQAMANAQATLRVGL